MDHSWTSSSSWTLCFSFQTPIMKKREYYQPEHWKHRLLNILHGISPVLIGCCGKQRKFGVAAPALPPVPDDDGRRVGGCEVEGRAPEFDGKIARSLQKPARLVQCLADGTSKSHRLLMQLSLVLQRPPLLFVSFAVMLRSHLSSSARSSPAGNSPKVCKSSTLLSLSSTLLSLDSQ